MNFWGQGRQKLPTAGDGREVLVFLYYILFLLVFSGFYACVAVRTRKNGGKREGGKFCLARKELVTSICLSDMKKALFVREQGLF